MKHDEQVNMFSSKHCLPLGIDPPQHMTSSKHHMTSTAVPYPLSRRTVSNIHYHDITPMKHTKTYIGVIHPAQIEHIAPLEQAVTHSTLNSQQSQAVSNRFHLGLIRFGVSPTAHLNLSTVQYVDLLSLRWTSPKSVPRRATPPVRQAPLLDNPA